jgi:NNP family nitrate/nitrite transporter-like MFS transporter
LSVLFGALALLFLGVAQFPPLAASMVLFFVIMGCLGIGNGSVFQLVPQRFRQRVGVATGILGAAGGLGGFFLPTLLGSLRQSSGSYGPGLMLFAALAVLALVVLAVVQNDWIGVWIAKHGRVRVTEPADSAEHAEPA